MRFGPNADAAPDDTDIRILGLLQDDCRTPLARLGEQVGLSAPAVLERIKKLEAAGVVTGYHAIIDGRKIGMDVTAFIGVVTSDPESIESFEQQVTALANVLECHHVTGAFTFLLKVKTSSTSRHPRRVFANQRLRVVPSTSSMATKTWSPEAPTSCTAITFACDSRAMACASAPAARPDGPKDWMIRA